MPFGSDHIADVVAIERLSFGVPWSYEAFAGELKVKNSESLVAILNKGKESKVVGYITGRWASDEAEIVNLAVHPDARRRGIARKLLLNLLDNLERKGVKKAFLEVRENNVAAIRLYEALGFKRVGLRKGYYVDTGEDALIMRLDIH